MSTAIATSGYTPAQLKLIRETVARDTNEQEFNLFFEACKAYGLDPFRKQISALVFNKTNAEKRQMVIIVSRDGYRVIAQRCGNYRPASEPAEIETDDDLKGPANPKGIVKATVKLWQQDKRGEWFPVIGEAYWDEFAALKDEWAPNASGKRAPTGNKTLEGNWARMPVVMITKCAESQALRAGWPDQFGGVYAEEEMQRVENEHSASDIIAKQEEADRAAKFGGRGILFSFDPSGVLENVQEGQVADRCADFIEQNDAETVYRWTVQNRAALQQFWSMAPSDALAIKKASEAKIGKLMAASAE